MPPKKLTKFVIVEPSEEKKPPEKKLTSKQKVVDEVFQPNEQGVSEWVERETWEKTDLNWGSNGNCRHGIYFTDNRYNWEKQGKKKITALRTNGFSEDHLYGAQRPIRRDIDKYYKAQNCVVCGSTSDLVTDHKNDLYNDPRVLDSKTQTLEDFQCLCNHCNLQKRQVSKATKGKGMRYAATNIPSLAIWGIDFISGNETFNPDDVNAMAGTYWYDPVAFQKEIQKRFLSKQNHD